MARADNAGPFTLDGTRTFILGSDTVAIIDPGPADRKHLQRVADVVSDAGAGTILVTHGHPDHSAGAAPLSSLTGFPVAGPEAAVKCDLPLVEGSVVSVDDGPVIALSTPGHARHHLSFLHGPDLFVGDLLLGRGDTTWVGAYSGCVRDYLASLSRIESLEVERLYPAHGPELTDPSDAIRRFRSHRLDRLGQVEKVLAELKMDLDPGPEGAGPGQAVAPDLLVEALLDRIYGSELPPRALEGARWSLHAALEYLGAAAFPPGGAPPEGGRRLAPGS
jgi:glyoxylase-like metal-dependent hydrolase (beta-lactamase superfamily II)